MSSSPPTPEIDLSAITVNSPDAGRPRAHRPALRVRREPLFLSPHLSLSRVPCSRRPTSARSRRPPWPVSFVPSSTSASRSSSDVLLLPRSYRLCSPFARTRAAAPRPRYPELRPPPQACSDELRCPRSPPTSSPGCGRRRATPRWSSRDQTPSVTQVRRVAAALLVAAGQNSGGLTWLVN